MRHVVVVVGMVAAMAASAGAQPPSQVTTDNVVTLRPAEKDTVGCRWERTMASGTASVRLIKPAAQADATPSGIVVGGPTASGNQVSVTLAPNQGCSVAGCRRGNRYQIDLLGTDSDGNTPECAILLKVNEVVY